MVHALLGCSWDEHTAAATTDPGHAQRRAWRWRGRWSERCRFHRRALPELGHVETKPDVAGQGGPCFCDWLGLAEAWGSLRHVPVLRAGLTRASRELVFRYIGAWSTAGSPRSPTCDAASTGDWLPPSEPMPLKTSADPVFSPCVRPTCSLSLDQLQALTHSTQPQPQHGH